MTSMDPTRQAWFDRARAHPIEGILAKRGFKLPLGTKNERKGPCPVCGGDDRFGLNISKQTFTCHQCGLKGAGGIDIIVGIGEAQTPWEAAEILEGPTKSNGHDTSTEKSRYITSWTYKDAEGKPYLKVARFEQPNGKKSYPQSYWDGAGWCSGKPPGPKIPYRLPELLDSDRTEPVFIVEGEKCADAVARLGVTATSASEGAGKWTPDLNEWFRDRTAYILPDNDGSGAKHAEQVACSLAGIAREVRIVNLPGLAAGDDVYDWIKRGGTREQLDELGGAASTFQATEEPAQARESGGLGDDRARSGDAPKRGRFELTRLDAIQIDDGAVYQIDGLLPAGPAFGLVVGLPKSLKSFLLMRAGLCIAAGLPFAGREVKQGAVVLITSEGLRGVKRRLIAMRKALGIEGKDVPFFLISAMPDLGTGTDDLKILIAEIEKALAGCGYSLAMVIIDTVRRATPGKDENSAKDMGGYIQNVDAIATRFRCIVMSVHHSPRGEEGRGSGSNALDGAADIIWVITREGASPTATATVAWMKDGEGEGTSWTFTLRTDVEIGRNQTDQPIFGCTVDIADANEPASTDKADKNKKPPWERGALPTFKLALIHVLDAHGTVRKPYPDVPEVRAVDANLVRIEFLKRYAADTQEAKATAWRRSLKDATQTYQLVGTREVEGAQLLWFARDEKPSP